MNRAAHNLRIPLTAILGETWLALRRLHKKEPLTDELRGFQQQWERIEE